jgi:NAD(P)-dependent dehydrogenase (short-subunit alcohol dehydrogenase family)
VTETQQKVAVITGGSQGIGAGIVDAYRHRGWAVVANSLSIRPSTDRDILTVAGDVSERATADRIMSQALDCSLSGVSAVCHRRGPAHRRRPDRVIASVQ